MTTDYNTIAAEYKEAKQQAWREHVESFTLFQLLGDLTGKSVVDLACGEGFYTRRLKARGASRVLGVDLSQKMVELGQEEEKRRPLGVRYQVGDVKDLDVRQMVVREKLRPGKAGAQAALQDRVGELAMLPLDRKRPLWQLHLVEDHEGGSALVFRIHHCIADGIALISVTLSLVDGGAPPPERRRRDAPAGPEDVERGSSTPASYGPRGPPLPPRSGSCRFPPERSRRTGHRLRRRPFRVRSGRARSRPTTARRDP